MINRFEEFNRNIALAHKYIIGIKSREMNKYGLKGANVMCLFFIGSHKDGLTPAELCSLCCEDKAGISKSLSTLKEKGYVAGVGEGKYKIKYTITDEGLEIYEEISRFIITAVDAAGHGLTENEREVFYKALEKIVLNLEKLTQELKDK